MLKNLVGLLFGQNAFGESAPPPRPPKQRIDAPALPEISAPCWRHVILGRSGIATANVPLQFLLKNNLRFVRRANEAEAMVAERIRITHNFFVQNQLLLGHEIRALGELQCEGEVT